MCLCARKPPVATLQFCVFACRPTRGHEQQQVHVEAERSHESSLVQSCHVCVCVCVCAQMALLEVSRSRMQRAVEDEVNTERDRLLASKRDLMRREVEHVIAAERAAALANAAATASTAAPAPAPSTQPASAPVPAQATHAGSAEQHTGPAQQAVSGDAHVTRVPPTTAMAGAVAGGVAGVDPSLVHRSLEVLLSQVCEPFHVDTHTRTHTNKAHTSLEGHVP